MPIGLSEGVILFAISAIVSLAVFAVNSKINSAKLQGQLDMRDLELRVEREYIKPAFDSLLAMVRHVEEQLQIRDELRSGFQQVQAALKQRRSADGYINESNG